MIKNIAGKIYCIMFGILIVLLYITPFEYHRYIMVGAFIQFLIGILIIIKEKVKGGEKK